MSKECGRLLIPQTDEHEQLILMKIRRILCQLWGSLFGGSVELSRKSAEKVSFEAESRSQHMKRQCLLKQKRSSTWGDTVNYRNGLPILSGKHMIGGDFSNEFSSVTKDGGSHDAHRFPLFDKGSNRPKWAFCLIAGKIGIQVDR